MLSVRRIYGDGDVRMMEYDKSDDISGVFVACLKDYGWEVLN